ncbi:MAG: EamA family transporter [Clostridia bacterium]|nr:EamA family transporter [Clostridia bacterium]
MDKQNKAALYALAGGIIWSFSGLFSRMVSWNSFTLVALRALVAAVILGFSRGSFRIRPNKGLWLCGLGISMTSLLYMSALHFTSTANAVVLQYTASVFVILYLFLVKRQKPLKSELIATFFVILGVCLCFSGGLSGGTLVGNLLGLLSGMTYAVVFLTTRYAGNDPVDSVYFGTLLSCALALAVPFDKGFSLTLRDLAIMLGLGCSLGLGYLFFSLGMRYGLSPVRSCIISNAEPVLNPIWVFLLLGENPGVMSILGAAVVLAAITVQSLYEARRTKAAH